MNTVLDFQKIKEKLFRLAKKNNYLTNDEILELILEPYKYINEIDDIFDSLFDKGINVFDKIAEEKDMSSDLEGPRSINLATLVNPKAGVDSVRMYLKEIGKIDLLTFKEEIELAQAIERGSEAAREWLTSANLRLVVSIAKKIYR